MTHFLRKKTVAVPIDEYLAQQLEASPYVNYDEVAGVKLQQALLKLSPQQRTAFTLKYYDDLSYEEMAKVTGSKPETLKVAYHNARKTIQNFIENE